MEEIQIRDALRHHVTDNEPPMGLSAAVLLSKGRRRHWWRMGVASGGTVVAISMVGTIALVPMGGTGPLLDSACSLPVITAFGPPPTAPPEHPSQYPTPYPTATTHPTEDPSPHPTAYPTAYPTYEPTPDPTSYPTTGPSFFPTQDPSGYPTMAPYPTVVPSHLTPGPSGPGGYPDSPVPTQPPFFPPDEARMREMECYLKRELQRMVPEAKFAQSGDQRPLSVYTGAELRNYLGVDLREDGRNWDFTYLATAVIIGPDQTIRFVIMVQKPSGLPLEPEAGSTFEKRGDLIIRQYSSTGGTTLSEVQTPHSFISAHSSGPLLSPEQLIELSSATEVDMFR